jgi:hypothetical protein
MNAAHPAAAKTSGAMDTERQRGRAAFSKQLALLFSVLTNIYGHANIDPSVAPTRREPLHS